MVKEIPRRYMMATLAFHKSGNISRDEHELCVVIGEDRDHWIGRWVEGFGFIDAHFPKATTRELNPVEKCRYHGLLVGINSQPAVALRIG